jgi:hypothetical protein
MMTTCGAIRRRNRYIARSMVIYSMSYLIVLRFDVPTSNVSTAKWYLKTKFVCRNYVKQVFFLELLRNQLLDYTIFEEHHIFRSASRLPEISMAQICTRLM